MENRVTRLIVPILIGVVVWVLVGQLLGPKDKKKDGGQRRALPIKVENAAKVLRANTGDSNYFLKEFGGEPDEPGFKVWFQEFGGTIKWIDLWDYFTEPGKRDADHLLRVIDAEATLRTMSFAIEDFQSRFPVIASEGKPPRRMDAVNWVRLPSNGNDNEVTYQLALANGLTIDKVYRFFTGSRQFQLTIRVKNTNKELAGLWRYRLRGASVLSNPKSENLVGMGPAQVFAAYESSDEIVAKAASGSPDPSDYPDVLRKQPNQDIAYAGSTSRFFTCILFPDDERTATAIEAVEIRSLPESAGTLPDTKPYTNCAPILLLKQRIEEPSGDEPGATELTFNIYLGPKSRTEFESNETWQQFLPVLDLDLESGCFCAPGAKPMAKFLLWLLGIFQSIVGNWGVAIIMLTILVRSALMPLNLRQAKAMRVYSQKMQQLKPEMDRIKEKHKNNPQRMNKELMEFNKKHKLFPPLMGCLPMLLTLPVFIGLFTALRASFELRHEPFVLWVNDLSLPDRLLRLGLTDLPLLGNGLEYLNVLPLLMTGLWVLNAFSQPLPEDPQQRSMQRMMRFMPVIFLVMLYGYASGLALYFTVSALWSFVEQRIVKKKIGAVGTPMPM